MVTELSSTFREKLRERRRIQAVVSDLVASRRTVETPSGLVTLVDVKFLRELDDVANLTGERLFAVVDELHLDRVAQVAGLIEQAPLVSERRDGFDPADLRRLRDFHRWTWGMLAREIGCSEQSIYIWQKGMSAPKGTRYRRIRELVDEMNAAIAAKENATQ